MKPRLTPIAALLLASGMIASTGASARLVNFAEFQSEATPEIAAIKIVEGPIVVAMDDEDSGKKQERRVEIVTSGDFSSLGELSSLGDLDSLAELGTAFSSAYSFNYGPGVMMRTGKPVKNAPYSAEVISETVQTLADGNQISKRNTTLTYRDGAGRTRQEVRDGKGEVKTIQIHDAADGSRIVLMPGKKTATKISMPADLKVQIEGIKEKAKAMAEKDRAEGRDAKSVVVEHPGPGQTIIVKRSEGGNADGKKEMREEIKVNVVRAGGETVVNGVNVSDVVSKALNMATLSGPISMSFRDNKWAGKATTTSLGSKDMEGVKVEGKMVSYTIPAGEVGNKNPITISTESWYSPDLQVTVYSKHSDPRHGDTIYRLANVKRAEPAQSLFTVPADYTVKEPHVGKHDTEKHTVIVK